MTGHLLAIDVGNSRVKLGLFDAATACDGRLPVCRYSSASDLKNDLPWAAIRDFIHESQSEDLHALIAGVNPQGVRKVLDSWPTDWQPPHVLDGSIGPVLKVDLAAPEKVGIDRLLNAVAANVVREPRRPAIIVDTGTATTVDYVNPEGAFAGGAILPGFSLMAQSLNEYTALLPLISMDELAGGEIEPIGLNTRHALGSGLYWGQLGAVKELITQFSNFTQTEPQLFLTGGGASLLATHLRDVRWEPHLSLQGLAIVLAKRLGDAWAGTTAR
jgi:type III pantothenate kinase